MDTYSAVPLFQRLPIRIIDREKFDDWMKSDFSEPMPTIVKVFIGYEKGPGTPTPVAIEVDRIETEYAQNTPTEEDEKTLDAYEYTDKWRRVNMILRRNLLCAVIRGLDIEDANILATEDDGPGRQILVNLGWLQKREITTEEVEENKEEGEVNTVDETGS